MYHYKIAFMAGLAMFAMFFGSGNLVFPLIIGATTADQFISASLGLFLTGVLVPFLGLFSMILYQGNKEQYFGLLGKWAPFTLTFLILSLIGPFGVVPRCILVSFGGFSTIYPEMPFYLFSIIFLLLIFAITSKKNKIVPIIGKYLGPLKILGIMLIILMAIDQSPPLIHKTQNNNPFILGVTQGYQTMDLMASFFFSINIIEYLNSICRSKKETIRVSLLASSIGGLLIAIVYLGLVYLGAHYSEHLVNVKPEQYLITIANLTLGEHATLIVAMTIFLSCLATSSSLVKLFAEFIRNDITNQKLSWGYAITITIIVSFIISLTGFLSIARLLHMLLNYIYPALIGLTISAILYKLYNFQRSKELFWLILFTSVIYDFLY